MAATIFVPLLAGTPFQSVPTGAQLSAKFVLTGPDGTRAVFNDQSDVDYVGKLSDVTGLDGPEVRESAEDLVQLDGGVHGDFYFGRRPLSLEGILLNPVSADDRNRRMTKIMRASNALRSDATLQWTLENGYEQYVKVRRQQSPRFNGNWQKTFQLGLVAADPRIYGISERYFEGNLASLPANSSQTIILNFNLNNLGNAEAPVIFQASGPGMSTFSFSNYTTGTTLALNATKFAGETLTVDMMNRTIMSSTSGTSYSRINMPLTSWGGLVPGTNNILISASNTTNAALTNGKVRVFWRDSWL